MKMPLPSIIRAEFDSAILKATQESDYYSAYHIFACACYIIEAETVT